MAETRVLLVFPGSLYGGPWARGPRVKPELVSLFSELRRAGNAVEVLDLEAECGDPVDDAGRTALLAAADERLAALPADLVVISCWSALQYTAAVAVAERVRRLHPSAAIAVCGYHASVRPGDFETLRGLFDWRINGEAELAAVELAARGAVVEARGACRTLEGAPLPLDAGHLPDYASYPYAGAGLEALTLFLSRGCPYNAPACLLRPGGGWHAYPPDDALRLLDAAVALDPRRIDVLDPAFGYDPAWRRIVLERLAAGDRRGLAISVAGRPDGLQRADVDRLYGARLRLHLEVGTLSPDLLARTGQAPHPQKAAAHALDLVEYANAKGLPLTASFTFNQPGETRETAAQTLDALEGFVAAAPNASVSLQAQPWAFLPAGPPEADIDAPAQRFGTRISEPEWWKQTGEARAAATAVVASSELADLPPGDHSYWRPRFEELRARLDAKLTAEARRGLRSHETVGSGASGVPHGWLIEARWH